MKEIAEFHKRLHSCGWSLARMPLELAGHISTRDFNLSAHLLKVTLYEIREWYPTNSSGTIPEGYARGKSNIRNTKRDMVYGVPWDGL